MIKSDKCCICLEKQECIKCNKCIAGLYCHNCLLLLIKNKQCSKCSICRQSEWLDKKYMLLDREYNKMKLLDNIFYNEELIHIDHDINMLTRQEFVNELSMLVKYLVPIYILIMIISLSNSVIL